MKKFEKLLQYSKRLEGFHISRRNRELIDIQEFDTRKERRKITGLDHMLPLDAAINESRVRKLDEQDLYVQQAEEKKAQHLIELEELAQQARDSYVNSAGNEFDVIAEIQGFTYQGELSQSLKQLPEASVNIFEHELTDSTEAELQQELEENQKAVQGPPKRLELQVETSESHPQEIAQRQASSPPGHQQSEPQDPALESTEEEEAKEQETSNTVFFFRQSKEPRK